jgi:hypothetical protein
MAAEAVYLEHGKHIALELNFVGTRELTCQATAEHSREQELLHGWESSSARKGQAAGRDARSRWEPDCTRLSSHQPPRIAPLGRENLQSLFLVFSGADHPSTSLRLAVSLRTRCWFLLLATNCAVNTMLGLAFGCYWFAIPNICWLYYYLSLSAVYRVEYGTPLGSAEQGYSSKLANRDP